MRRDQQRPHPKIAPPLDAEVMRYERNIMSTEVATTRLVRQNPSIPVPEIYFFDDARDVCDSNYFFMRRVMGDSLERTRGSLPPETLAAVDEQVGAIIRAVNGFPGAYFGYDGNPDLRAATWKEAFRKAASDWVLPVRSGYRMSAAAAT